MNFVDLYSLSNLDLDTYRAQLDVTKPTVVELSDWQIELVKHHCESEENELCFIEAHKGDRVIGHNRLGYVCFRESSSDPITHLVNTVNEVYEEVF